MLYYQKYQGFDDAKFRRMVGVSKEQFVKILVLFKDYVSINWSKRGRPGNFTLEDKLLLTFRYLRDYPTFIVLSNEFGISEGYTQKIFTRVSNSLVKIFKLPNLESLQDIELQTVIIDVSEQETERPKKTKFKR